MYGISGNGFFLPAAILNFINLQGTLGPRCTSQDRVVIGFRRGTGPDTQTGPCVWRYKYTFLKIPSTFLSLEILPSNWKSRELK